MIYILGILVGAMIVAGQVFWKIGIERISDTGLVLGLNFQTLIKIILSPYIIVGLISYGFATICYMLLLGKYEYTSLQAVVVSASLTTTFIAAYIIFSESISGYNLVGLAFLLVGVVLITKF